LFITNEKVLTSPHLPWKSLWSIKPKHFQKELLPAVFGVAKTT